MGPLYSLIATLFDISLFEIKRVNFNVSFVPVVEFIFFMFMQVKGH